MTSIRCEWITNEWVINNFFLNVLLNKTPNKDYLQHN